MWTLKHIQATRHPIPQPQKLKGTTKKVHKVQLVLPIGRNRTQPPGRAGGIRVRRRPEGGVATRRVVGGDVVHVKVRVVVPVAFHVCRTRKIIYAGAVRLAPGSYIPASSNVEVLLQRLRQ